MYSIKEDVVAIDHAQLDMMVVEEGIMDRPWLTLIVDELTRLVLGVRVNNRDVHDAVFVEGGADFRTTLLRDDTSPKNTEKE